MVALGLVARVPRKRESVWDVYVGTIKIYSPQRRHQHHHHPRDEHNHLRQLLPDDHDSLKFYVPLLVPFFTRSPVELCCGAHPTERQQEMARAGLQKVEAFLRF